MAQFAFNPQQFQPQTPQERAPRGWYPAVMFESDIEPTAAKDGFRLVTKFKIIDGPYKGKTISKGFNIDNPSPKAVEISLSEIKTICSCVGKFNPINDSQEMHNIPLQILLTEPKDSDYNDIKGYKTIDGLDATAAGQGAAVGHQQIPQQGFGNAPAPQYGAPAQPAYAPAQPQYAPAHPAYQQPAYAPAQPQYGAPQQAQAPYAPPQPQYGAPVTAQPAYAAPAPQQAPAPAPAPSPAPGGPPTWQPGNQPAAPAWAQPAQR